MKSRLLLFLPLALLLGGPSHAQSEKSSVVERVGDTAFIRADADSFNSLTPRQQQLAYWLVQASIATDPITYAQFSRFGLRQKRLLEEIVAQSSSLDPALRSKILDYAKLFWGNRGNHNDLTAQKFLPAFTFDEFKSAALAAQNNGAFKSPDADLQPIPTAEALTAELDDLRASIFDPNFEPMLTAKTPPPGQDIIQASSNTFYEGVTLADLKAFHEFYPLNSRVVRDKDGRLLERAYRAGTPDGSVAPGLYAVYLTRAIGFLTRAQQVADPAQAKVIGDLIRFFETGDPKDWLQFGTDWVQNDAVVDFDNGFIEVYRDARGMKGSAQSFVSVTDQKITATMVHLGQNAEYFEAKAPWADQYKRKAFQPPVVKAIETLVEDGDFSITTIGDNLPNENEVHEKYGSKNFIFTGSTRALNSAQGSSVFTEFAATPEIAARNAKYGDEAEDLLTALHEVIGHGSGKLSDRVHGGAEAYLKEYYSTLEEGRADLMGLWNVWDPKLKDLGLVSNQDEVAKAMYDSAAQVALSQLRRIQHGDTIEEDHERDRQLIVNYIKDRVPGSIEQFDRNAKTYIQVKDYQKMRQGVGMLLSELMRIKAEGDYDAIKTLVDKYGVHFDPALRDQVVARFRKLNLPTYFAGINALLIPTYYRVELRGVRLSYPTSVEQQYLYYASMYNRSLRHPPAGRIVNAE